MSLIRGTSIVAGLTLVSRVLGFVREVLIARLFGASAFSDAFFVAFRIPNLLRSLFAEGALTSAFVPVIATENRKGLDEAQKAFSAVLGMLLVCAGGIAILGMAYSGGIVSAFAPGFDSLSERFSLCVELTRIMFPYIIFVSIVALLNGTLNTFKIFGASAWAQVVMNGVLIMGAYTAGYFEKYTAAHFLAWSVIAGGAIQVLAQLPALRRSGLKFIPNFFFWISPARKVLVLMIPAIFGAAIYQVTIFLNTLLASLLETGSVSWLSYADRLAQLPMGIFTIALSSVLLPTLSNAFADDNPAIFSKSLSDSLRFTSFIMVPSSIFLTLFAHQIICLIFERGNFDAHATLSTSSALSMYAIGLWAISCHSMLIRALQARHDTVSPTIVGFIALVSTFIGALLLMGSPVNSDSSILTRTILSIRESVVANGSLSLGAAGLALASSVSFFIAFIISLVLVLHRVAEFSSVAFLATTFRCLISSIVAALLCGVLNAKISGPLLETLVGGLVFSITYILMMKALKSPEIEETFGLISRLKRRNDV